jgi:Pentapeptide repeats (8 copies)
VAHPRSAAGAQLHGARLYLADLSDAQLQGAVLLDAQLQVTHLDDAALEGAVYGAGTRWPSWFDPTRLGPFSARASRHVG